MHTVTQVTVVVNGGIRVDNTLAPECHMYANRRHRQNLVPAPEHG